MHPNYQSKTLVAAGLCLVSLLCACGGDSPKPATQDTSERDVVTVPMQQERSGEFNPQNIEGFHELVYREYAGAALALPKKTMDSIMRSTNPPDIEKVMTRYLHGQDTIARKKLAAKYNITVDSLNAIITSREKK
jgi:hypothetical protein